MRNMISVVNKSKTWRDLINVANSHGWCVRVSASEVDIRNDKAQYTFTKTESFREFLKRDIRFRITNDLGDYEVEDRYYDEYFVFSTKYDAIKFCEHRAGKNSWTAYC